MKTNTSTIQDNIMGLDGFEFVEFASPNPEAIIQFLETLGFTIVAKHRSKQVMLLRQGNINFIVNQEPDSHGVAFAKEHGPCTCAIAFKVKDSQYAFERAIKLGAKPYLEGKRGSGEANIPTIYGIGGSLIYFVSDSQNIYETDFIPLANASLHPTGQGLTVIDHLTHNVFRGNMDKWADDFYGKIFNFYETRYFDIEGQRTGLTSRVLVSPCGKIRMPLNQSKDNKSQIEEHLKEYKGEGIQHIALATTIFINLSKDCANKM